MNVKHANQIIAIPLLFTTSEYCAAKEQKAEKPNILFIFADDQRADALGCSGNIYINTPNIDKLAHNRVRFTNSYLMGGNQAAIMRQVVL